MRLERKILLGFGAGVVVGLVARAPGMASFAGAVSYLEPVGTVFIRLITMVVVPLVVASVFVGVASLGDIRSLGRVGAKTLIFFFATTLVAALIGLLVATTANVGTGFSIPSQEAAQAGSSPAVPGVVQTLINLVPQNPFAAAAQGGADLLPLIVAVCFFGAAATVVGAERRQPVVRFFEGVNEMAMVVVGWLMRLAPYGVFALIAAAVARSGIGLLDQLLAFGAVVVVALLVHAVVVLVPVLRLGAGRPVGEFFRATSDALFLAFSTASSNATLPVSMAAATDRLGVPGDVASFVLPAGASLNKNGSAAYKAVTAVLIAHLYGLPLTAAAMITIVMMATVAAFAGAGVPGSSLVTTLIVLNAIGLGPRAAAGMALVAAIDRPLDMCRSAVNTMSNLVGAAWVARTERVGATHAVGTTANRPAIEPSAAPASE
ncbi:MAG TPA: dicarboxylate/amino acid:cation symporter [Gemmatimonadaceae bacterium]